MLELVRQHKRWMLFLVLILILPSFVFFGIEGYARFMDGDQALAKVNGNAITRAEYDAARRNQLDRARQMLGGAFDPIMFDTPEMRQQTLDQLIDSRVIAAAMIDGHFTVSDGAVRQAIATIPAVQSNGRFDPELYTQVLATQGMAPAQFEAAVRYDLAQSQVLQPVAETGVAPRALVEVLLQAMVQERTVRLRTFNATEYLAGIKVTEDEVRKFYDDNAAAFHVPEVIDAQYVVLDSQAAMRGVTATADEVAAYYEQNKQRFTNPEFRSVSHILVLVPDGASAEVREQARLRAQQLADRARENPAGFADLARAESQDVGTADAGGSLGAITRGSMVPEFEAVAFKLKEGEVSGVVQTDFGFHVIKADEVRPGSVKTLDEVRDQLSEEIRMQKAGARFGEMASRLTDIVYDQADSLDPVVQELGLELRSAQGIAREGAPAGSPEIFSDLRVRQSLFSNEVAREHRNSGVIELAPDRLVVVRAERVVPAHTAELTDVSEEIRDRLASERALQASETAGVELLESLRSGNQTVEGFAEPITVSRADAGQVDGAVMQAIMGVPHDASLPAYTGAKTFDGYVVAMVEKIEAGAVPGEEAIKAEQGALGNALAQAQVVALMQNLRKRYKVEIESLAAQVITESPDN